MTLIKFEPLTPCKFLGNNVHRLYGELPINFNYDNTFSPKIDISEDEKNIYFEAEVPGIAKEDINISLEDNIITIKGEKKVQQNNYEKILIRNERMSGLFTRSFTLHEEVNSDTANAEFENGVLKIVLEKIKQKAVKERQIQVK